MSLDKYKEKRNFKVSPEPSGKVTFWCKFKESFALRHTEASRNAIALRLSLGIQRRAAFLGSS